MSAEWIAFLSYVLAASGGIAAAITGAVAVTRRSRAGHHLDAAERLS
jgi:hypothetical protein